MPNCLYKTIKIVSLSMFYLNEATNSIRPAFSQFFFLLIELAVIVFATCALDVASETFVIHDNLHIHFANENKTRFNTHSMDLLLI